MTEPLSDREYFERLFVEHHHEHKVLADVTTERALIVQRELERRDVSVKELAAGIQRDSDRRDVLAQRETDKRDENVSDMAKLHSDAHAREHLMNDAALHKAETSMDKRLEGMNEFRQSLNDQAGTMVRREVMEAAFSAIAAKFEAEANGQAARIAALEHTSAVTAGRDHGIGMSWTVLVALIATTGIVVGIITHFLK